MRVYPLLSATVVLSLGAMPAAAQLGPIAVPNHSFEDAAGYWAAGPWTNASTPSPNGDPGVVEVSTTARVGKDGNNFLLLHMENGNPSGGTGYFYALSPDLGTFQANTLYSLTVSIALGQGDGWQPEASAGIGLRANGVNQNLTYFEGTSLSADFADRTVVLDTSTNPGVVGQSISVVLAHEHRGNYFRGIGFDNVRLTAIPEPAHWAGLMGLLVLGLAWVCHQRGR